MMEALRNKNVNLPYCAFNGGCDAWVDVGDKARQAHIDANDDGVVD